MESDTDFGPGDGQAWGHVSPAVVEQAEAALYAERVELDHDSPLYRERRPDTKSSTWRREPPVEGVKIYMENPDRKGYPYELLIESTGLSKE